MRFTLRQLEVFVAVAKQESVSRAAESLALSQSAASTSLSELERQSDCQLFDRAGKRLSLNALGRQLLPQAVALLDQAREIERLLSGVRALVPLQPQAEITLEANPGTFEKAKFRGFKDAGITRLSIGVQSFNDQALQALGRIHSRHEALAAIDAALALFERVNIDLMYALPRQNMESARQDVHTALATGAGHISAYHLTMEPNTPFGHTPPSGLPHDDAAQDIEDAVHQIGRAHV